MLSRCLLTAFILCGFGLSSQAQGLWVKKANIGGEARHRSSGFSIGSKGYIGGGHINSGTTITYSDWWEYDPASDSWTQIADYGGGQRYQLATFSLNGEGYAGCGEDGAHNYTSDFWKYNPSVNTWFPIADLPGLPRRGAASFVINNVPYVGLGQSGGPTAGGYEVDFYQYDVDSDEWYPIADFIGTARTSAVGFAHGDKGYIGTGHMVGAATRDFYEYNSLTNSWTQLADVDTTHRQDATGFQLNGKGYILTGNDNLGELNYDDVWEYDFAADTWTQLPDFPGSARRFFVSFVIGGVAYAGSGTNGTNLNDFWMYDPTFNSVDEFDEQNVLEIYPNPAIDYVNINVPAHMSGDLMLQIYSADGKLVLQETMISNQLTLNREEIGKGIFIVKLLHSTSIIGSKKFIFQ